MGTVWDTNGIPANILDIRTIVIQAISVCCGYRITMDVPIGAVGVLLRQPFKKYDGDKAEQFQFNIGKPGKCSPQRNVVVV